MASCYAHNRLVHEALKLFVLSLRKDVRPTEFTFASLLSSSSCFGLGEQGAQIHCWICKVGLEGDMIIANALMDMYAKLGSIDYARNIFSMMVRKDMISWNTIIMSLAQNSQGVEALMMFRKMQENGHVPDRITLFAVLLACGHEGLVQEGWRIFSLMEKKYRVTKVLEHYACVVDMLGRAGRLEEAMNVVEAMSWEATLWDKLLEACLLNCDFSFAEVVATKMMEMKSRSAIPYIVLARIYAAKGKWESMALMWGKLEGAGADKVKGCSWICTRNRIATFEADQLLPERGEALYPMLHLLIWDMESEGYIPEVSGLLWDNHE